MGNSAIVLQSGKHTGVYLHWNGGRDSVEAFLKYCELKGYRGFEDSYGLARFCQVVGNFFGGGLSLGVVTDVYPSEDNYMDNGIYSVKGWKIVNRYHDGPEQQNYDLTEMLQEIDEAQPTAEQFGAEFWKAQTVKVENIRPGDTVFYIDPLEGKCSKHICVGIGADQIVNGRNVLGIPYIDLHCNEGRYDRNPNNYLQNRTYKVIFEH